jgi:hypothetical protein
VLDSDTGRFDAELDHVLAAFNERQSVVQLYRALGGGWFSAAAEAAPRGASSSGAASSPAHSRASQ